MSIAPPSDIILDVAQAADPQRLQAATAKLANLAAGGMSVGPEDFSSLLASAAAEKPAPPKSYASSTLAQTLPSTLHPQSSPYRKFEAVLLQTFVQEMLPKDEHLFGDAASADICRSMLAEQLAAQLSKTDKFGIARMIEKAHGPTGTTPTATLPATTTLAAGPEPGGTEPAGPASRRSVTASL